jgi:hypothetical protein
VKVSQTEILSNIILVPEINVSGKKLWNTQDFGVDLAQCGLIC